MSMHNASTLKGICEGILADGELNQTEAEYLLNYLNNSPASLTNEYPANILIKRLVSSLKDGVLDEEEMSDLLGILLEIINGVARPLSQPGKNTVDLKWHFDDCPIDFINKTFVVTGTFESSSRAEIESFIVSRGGTVNKKIVTRNTDYVIVGSIISAGWIAGNYGRKIESALQYRNHGNSLKIVSESHWLKAVKHNSYSDISLLLKSLWPSATKQHSRKQKTLNLIVNRIIDGDKFDNDHWGFKVPFCFRSSLDINLDERVKDKKTYSVWTQGSMLSFKQGDMMFSQDDKTSLQVLFGNPGGWDDDKNAMDEGSVTFVASSWLSQNEFLSYIGQATVTQMDFLKILVDGISVLDEISFTPYEPKHLKTKYY